MMIRIENRIRKNLGRAPSSHSKQALARNVDEEYYYYYYYQGFIPDGIVSEQCAATTAIGFYNPKIYGQDITAEIDNGMIDQDLDFLLCLNGSCDTFQTNCETYGG